MELFMLFIFILGFILIALEHLLKINKSAIALLTGISCWVVFILYSSDFHMVLEKLEFAIGELSAILFFLMGAMVIVELIDSHNGFNVIIEKIHTPNKRYLLIFIGIISFFLSAILDNLTTAIVLVSIIMKTIHERHDRIYFIGIVIIGVNAGGAWSPIGDVTTTMLWIGGQITPIKTIASVFLPSLICFLVPFFVILFKVKGNIKVSEKKRLLPSHLSRFETNVVFFTGIGVLISVPVFKTLTHLPPFMGILFGLGILWVMTEIFHKDKEGNIKDYYSVTNAMKRIDMPSILFFFGILLAVASLQAVGTLGHFAKILDQRINDPGLIALIIGFFSSIFDNVPLVAGAIGMYPLAQFQTDHVFWQYIAYSAGTGGSILMIGSAAGIAAMGISKINFIEYFKKVSLLAFLGFISGFLIFLI